MKNVQFCFVFLINKSSPSPVGESNVSVRGVRAPQCGDSLRSPLLLYSLIKSLI